MEEKFTVEEFRKYVGSQDSLGDVLYFLNAENIRKANQKKDEDVDEDDMGPSVEKCIYYDIDRCSCPIGNSFYCHGLCSFYKEEI